MCFNAEHKEEIIIMFDFSGCIKIFSLISFPLLGRNQNYYEMRFETQSSIIPDL